MHRTHFGTAWLKIALKGFPGGAVVESLPANAGDTGSGPGLGGSRMPGSSWAREPQLLSLHVWSLCSATREAAIVRGPHTAMKSGPRLPQLEKALAQKRRPNTAKINKFIKKKNCPQYYYCYVVTVKGSCVSREASMGVAGKAFESDRVEFEFQLCQLTTGYDLGQVTSLL